MNVEFTQIRNQIRRYKRDGILRSCYNFIDNHRDEMFQIWNIFSIMKWTYQHAEFRYPSKEIDEQGFRKICNLVYHFNNDHVSNFLRVGKLEQAMSVLHTQQFYLQKPVYLTIFAMQLKLYKSLDAKSEVAKSFKNLTSIEIQNFLFITQYLWIFVQSKNQVDNPLKFYGYVNDNMIKILCEIFDKNEVQDYFNLIVLKSDETLEKIENFKRALTNPGFQIFETSFFTLYPFHEFDSRVKLIHPSIFNYFSNYFIYDFLKANDESFTTTFGNQFEKYIDISLKEAFPNYLNETAIKNLVGKNKNLIDFCIPEQNIFIECKAIEVPIYPSVNPTDDLIFSSLKDSILKAYYKQLTSVAKALKPFQENWGIILTYKELFWSDFQKLHELCNDKFDCSNCECLPPENVFIIDITTWNKIIYVVKTKQSSLPEILEIARTNNSIPETRKQLFSMHLDEFDLGRLDLSFLNEEIEQLKF